MEKPESDDLSQLAPNLQLAARQQAASPGNTAALREYIRVLGEKPGNVPALPVAPPAKPRTDGLAPRTGTGRRPPRRYFTIKWRVDDPDAKARAAAEAAEAEAAALDPEALKHAIVEQARAQRAALLQAGWRQGTGRMPRPREFSITLPPLQLEEEEEQQLLQQEGEEEALLEEEWAAADGQGGMAAEEEWEEEGVLAEQAALAGMQPADATPGAALARRSEQGEAGSVEQGPAGFALAPGSSQRGQARTPGTSLLGRYTPMEGVPEREARLATRGKGAAGASGLGPAATASRFGARAAGTPAGFTPMEGVMERLHAFQPLPGATRLGSNAGGRPSVDSPVEGLVMQGAARSRLGAAVAARLADGAGGSQGEPRPQAGAEGGFGGFAPSPHPPSPEALPAPAGLLAEQAAAEEAAPAADAEEAGPAAENGWDEDDDDMGGGFDDGGYDDEELPLGEDAQRAPFMADAGVQTGASLEEEAEEGAADGFAGQAGEEEEEEDALQGGEDGDYDAGGDYGLADGYGDNEQPHADLPETSAAAAAQRPERRQTRNPGVRLRNELKRKSLAADPRIGRHEVLPGVRRSSRQHQQPLKWWLNEKKEFSREHKTMPTVSNWVHKVPNTPWQTVTDFKRRPAKKQRAPTPHALEGDMAGAEAGEEEVEEEHEEVEAEEAAAEEQWQQDGGEGEEQAEQEEEEEAEQQPQDGGAAGEQAAEEDGEDGWEEAAGEEDQQPRRTARHAASGKQQQQKAAGRRQTRSAAAAAPAPPARGKATKKKAAGGKRRKARR